jgi:Subtilase family
MPAAEDGRGNAAELPKYLSPYEAWNFGAGLGYALPGLRKFTKYLSALAELRPLKDGDNPIQRVEAMGYLPTLWDEYKKLSFVPFVLDNRTGSEIADPKLLEHLLLVGLNLALDLVPAQAPDKPEAKFAKIKHARFRVAFPVPDAAMCTFEGLPPDPICEPDTGLRDRIGPHKRITIMAVIDDGLPFAHRNFRDAGGSRTRVEFCWLQSVAKDDNCKTVRFGREYTRKQIDQLIADYGDDEDALYEKAGAMVDSENEDFGSLIARHGTHGAHVMDLATGYAPDRDYAPELGKGPPEEIRIIAVQLPNTIALDTSGFGKDMYMLAALHYIFNRADLIAKCYGIDKPRLVINFSYGFSGGRHDGETELEAAINEMIEKRRAKTGPTALVLASGNTFLDKLHGTIREADLQNDAAAFPWRIQPNDRAPCYLELWFFRGFNPQGYTIELLDPRGGRHSYPLEIIAPPTGADPGKTSALLVDKKLVGQVSADMHRADDPNRPDEPQTGRLRVLVIMAPTEPEDDSLPGLPAGKWTVLVKRDESAAPLDEPIQCWIQRSADPDMLRTGSRQSYFDDLEDLDYNLDGSRRESDTEDAFVRRFGSLNGLATGGTSLVVGGYRLGRGLESSLRYARPSSYSCAGTLDYGWPETEVACSSMSDRSKVLPGTVAAGVRSGSLSFVQGTSAAAPFVARQLAEAFVTEEDGRVKKAERENYRPLLAGEYAGNEAERRARLGEVLVPPHRQPGVGADLSA